MASFTSNQVRALSVAESAEQLGSIATDEGVELAPEEAGRLFRAFHALSDEQLKKIVGGVTYFESFDDLELALTGTMRPNGAKLPIAKPTIL